MNTKLQSSINVEAVLKQAWLPLLINVITFVDDLELLFYHVYYFSDLTDVKDVLDPLSKVTAGLVSQGDDPVPLQAVHIRAKLLDLSAKVRIPTLCVTICIFVFMSQYNKL